MSIILMAVSAALNLKFPLAKTLEDTRKAALCGRYETTAKASLYQTFTFSGGETVTSEASGMENAQPYFVHQGRLFVLADKAVHELTVFGGKLAGVDEWTAKATFARPKKPAKACAPFAGSKAAEAKVEHLLCYLQGVDLQAASKMGDAVVQYESCCKGGDAISCNKQGFMLDLGAGGKRDPATAYALFTKSCDMGYGGGCSNAGDARQRAGKKDEAMKLFKKGCELGFKDACLRELDL